MGKRRSMTAAGGRGRGERGVRVEKFMGGFFLGGLGSEWLILCLVHGAGNAFIYHGLDGSDRSCCGQKMERFYLGMNLGIGISIITRVVEECGLLWKRDYIVQYGELGNMVLKFEVQ